MAAACPTASSTALTAPTPLSGLEKDISGLKREIKERDDTIGDKERRIYELKKKNQVWCLGEGRDSGLQEVFSYASSGGLVRNAHVQT